MRTDWIIHKRQDGTDNFSFNRDSAIDSQTKPELHKELPLIQDWYTSCEIGRR